MASGKGNQSLEMLFGMGSGGGDTVAVAQPTPKSGGVSDHLGASLSLPVMLAVALVALWALREVSE